MNKSQITIGLIVIVILGYVTLMTVKLNNTISDLQQELVIKSNELDDRIVSTKVIQYPTVDDFLEIRTKDSIILELQRLVQYYQDRLSHGSVTEIRTETKFDTITQVVTVNDTMRFDYVDDWIRLSGSIFDSTLDFNLKTKDRIQLLQLDDNTVEVFNDNPYSITNGINTFSIVPKKSRISWGLSLGPGIFYDITRSQFGLGLGLTLGINLNF